MIEPRNLREAAETIKSQIAFPPKVALILGSGLGDFADQLQNAVAIASSRIPHYPSSTVQGHEGKLVFGTVRHSQNESPPLLVFKGRVHLYESGNLSSTLFPVALARELGAGTLIVTNAAGGINRSFSPGDLMLIRDFLGLTFLSVKSHLNFRDDASDDIVVSRSDRLRRHSSLDGTLQEVIRTTAREFAVPLQEGTYCWLKGPSYETAAEIEMLSRVGVDAVGMSTVPEMSLGMQLGMKVAGISLISNFATGITEGKLSHQEVTETAHKVRSRFTNLLSQILLRLR
ncbi:MAG: purine-nucleoside phosphorylase [Ignavibacteriales bacterium]|nr:purine-nucleoside phosphorylase [Ignavibacteriales bacterium]